MSNGITNKELKESKLIVNLIDISNILFCDDEDKTSTLIQGSGTNYKSKAIIINESGLYSLILSSKLPTTKKFKHFVFVKLTVANSCK